MCKKLACPSLVPLMLVPSWSARGSWERVAENDPPFCSLKLECWAREDGRGAAGRRNRARATLPQLPFPRWKPPSRPRRSLTADATEPGRSENNRKLTLVKTTTGYRKGHGQAQSSAADVGVWLARTLAEASACAAEGSPPPRVPHKKRPRLPLWSGKGVCRRASPGDPPEWAAED